jgi:uncharacterized protein involved in exopolysaccharide biosynthesis
MDSTVLKSIDPKYIWQIIWKRKWFLIIPPFISLSAAFVYAFFIAKPVYESKAVIRIGDSRRIASNYVERLVPGARGIDPANILRREILSYANIKLLIDALNLKEDPDISKLKEEAQKVKMEYPNLSMDEILEVLLVDKLKEDFRVSVRSGRFLEISGIAHSPTKAYLLVKTLTDIFIEGLLREELDLIRSSGEFGSDQLEIYRKRLEEAERELERYRQKLAIAQVENPVEIQRKIDLADSLLAAYKVNASEKEEQIRKIDRLLGPFLRGFSVHQTDSMRVIKRKLLDNIAELSRLSMRLSWKAGEIIRLNHEVRRLNEQMKRLIEKKINEELQDVDERRKNLLLKKQIMLLDLDVLYIRQREVGKIMEEYQKKLEQVPTISLNLKRLEEEVKSYRQVYNLFLQQSRGAEIEQAIQRAESQFKIKIIEPPQKPLAPVKPKKRMILFMALLLGLGIGGAAIYGLEFLDQTYKDVKLVEKDLGIPVLGVIPKLEYARNGYLSTAISHVPGSKSSEKPV